MPGLSLILFAVMLPGHRQQEATLPRWLAGCWELRQRGSVAIEMWMPPDGGLMLGASRTVANGTVREYEQVELRLEKGRLVYTAHPSGQATATFASTTVTDSGFVVENPQHDFPQRISYRRRGARGRLAWHR